TAMQLMQWYETARSSEKDDDYASVNNTKRWPADVSFEALSKYCIDKREQIKDQPRNIIARNKEIRQIFEIISRKAKSNVIIIGDSGVGKTAMLDGFATTTAAGKGPQHLINIAMYELDNSALLAGASY